MSNRSTPSMRRAQRARAAARWDHCCPGAPNAHTPSEQAARRSAPHAGKPSISRCGLATRAGGTCTQHLVELAGAASVPPEGPGPGGKQRTMGEVWSTPKGVLLWSAGTPARYTPACFRRPPTRWVRRQQPSSRPMPAAYAKPRAPPRQRPAASPPRSWEPV